MIDSTDRAIRYRIYHLVPFYIAVSSLCLRIDVYIGA